MLIPSQQANTPTPTAASTETGEHDRTTAARWNGSVGAVLAYSQADPTARFVLVAIAQHADGAGGRARPTMGRIAALTGLDYGTVRRAIIRLEELGELVTSRTGRAHRYAITLDVPDPCGEPPSAAEEGARPAESDRAPRAIGSRATPTELPRTPPGTPRTGSATHYEAPVTRLIDQADALRRQRAADLDAELEADRRRRLAEAPR